MWEIPDVLQRIGRGERMSAVAVAQRSCERRVCRNSCSGCAMAPAGGLCRSNPLGVTARGSGRPILAPQRVDPIRG